ncbi:MAG: formylglycine-generating enzyme family protein [Planctomycetota bacterium]|nr:formylglycine-generating enzyme family protein [Planctomycetota bacterium]
MIPLRLPTTALVAALVAASCGHEGSQQESLARSGPLGSLRDLVLFDRSFDAGGPFFVDRFEVTRGDWSDFASTPEGAAVGAEEPEMRSPSDEVLPVGKVDLRQARAFARWRRCRLPRTAEWEYARTGGGRRAYPWGEQFEPARANTAELALGSTLPVGTFESGRSGSGPYDLIGNVAEWTETVPGVWFRLDRGLLSPMQQAIGRVRQQPALTIWNWSPSFMPIMFVVQAGDVAAPREVLGGHFLEPSVEERDARAPTDFSDTVGVRLCTTPRELLQSLADGMDSYSQQDLEQLRRFFARGRNAEVMRQARAALDLTPAQLEFLAPFLAEL